MLQAHPQAWLCPVLALLIGFSIAEQVTQSHQSRLCMFHVAIKREDGKRRQCQRLELWGLTDVAMLVRSHMLSGPQSRLAECTSRISRIRPSSQVTTHPERPSIQIDHRSHDQGGILSCRSLQFASARMIPTAVNHCPRRTAFPLTYTEAWPWS